MPKTVRHHIKGSRIPSEACSQVDDKHITPRQTAFSIRRSLLPGKRTGVRKSLIGSFPITSISKFEFESV